MIASFVLVGWLSAILLRECFLVVVFVLFCFFVFRFVLFFFPFILISCFKSGGFRDEFGSIRQPYKHRRI